jgi:predicted unusual protein kinase regulating ubiquinone biosynthesis (AarF/ABC1/UbiB family)
MRYRPISERVNLLALLDEFAEVLWEELDYVQEGRNAERFSAAFADDPGVYVPAVYWGYTTKRVLVLEDVTSIKIGDYDAITAAGISRPEVAQRLLDVYLRQIFEIRFFHADPHPGNLFVYALPEDAPQARAQDTEGRPFYLVFVDFGMTGTLTDEIVNGIRKGVVAVFSQDVRGVLDAFDELGMFMPGADRERMEEAARVMFDRVWGLSMVEMADFAFDEMRDLAREFSDLMFEMPFQVPQNFLYLGRAISILSGMCTGIDPTFDPWRAMEPYAERLIQDEQANTLDTMIEVAGEFARSTIRLPGQLSDMLRRIDRGDITFKAAPNRTFQRQVNRIEIYAARGVMAVLSAGFMISAAILRTNDDPLAGWSFLLGATFFGLMLLRGRRTLT